MKKLSEKTGIKKEQILYLLLADVRFSKIVKQMFGNIKYYCIFAATFCGGISTRCLTLKDF